MASQVDEVNEDHGVGDDDVMHISYQDPVLREVGYYVVPPVKWVIHVDSFAQMFNLVS